MGDGSDEPEITVEEGLQIGDTVHLPRKVDGSAQVAKVIGVSLSEDPQVTVEWVEKRTSTFSYRNLTKAHA